MAVGSELAEERVAPIDEAVGADRDKQAAAVANAVQLGPVGAAPVIVVGACQSGQAEGSISHAAVVI